MTGTINQQETNFRVQALQIDELLGGTTCRGGQQGNHGNYHHPSHY